jgi:predicted transcriptional regulator
MVEKNKNIWIKVPERGRGKNNYNKYNTKIQDIIHGLDTCLPITKLCKHAALSHQTMIKYLYRLMYLEREKFFS